MKKNEQLHFQRYKLALSGSPWDVYLGEHVEGHGYTNQETDTGTETRGGGVREDPPGGRH